MKKGFQFAAAVLLMAVFFVAGVRFCAENQIICVVGRNDQDYVCTVECLGREDFYFAAYRPLPDDTKGVAVYA